MDIVGPYHFDMFSVHAIYASFPSGHAITVFAVASAIALFARRTGLVLLLPAVAVAISRVAIGAHYPSDVLAGAALGFVSALVMRRVFAERRIAFAGTRRGIRARGAGIVWPALVTRRGAQA
jgi:undecaprenyl-diphosphatase